MNYSIITILSVFTIINIFVMIRQYKKEEYKSAMFSAFSLGCTLTSIFAISLYINNY